MLRIGKKYKLGGIVLLSINLVSPIVVAEGKIGVGIGLAPDYEGSDDSEAMPALFGRYRWDSGRYVSLGATHEAGRALRLKANLISDAWSPIWRMGPVVQYRAKRDDVDNSRVDDMKDIDAATELGAYIEYTRGPWGASLTYAADVSDEHDGALTELAGWYTVSLSNEMTLKFGASASYADDDYMNTYFGVNSKNVGSSGFSSYDADGGFKDVGLSVTAEYGIDQNWGLQGVISYYRLMNDAKDSPLVDDVGDKNQFSVGLSVTYSF